MKYWFLHHQHVLGPHDAEELARIPGYSGDVMVCPEGLRGRDEEDWRRAGTFPELSASLLKVPPLPPSPAVQERAHQEGLEHRVYRLEHAVTGLRERVFSRESEIAGLQNALESKAADAGERAESLERVAQRVDVLFELVSDFGKGVEKALAAEQEAASRLKRQARAIEELTQSLAGLKVELTQSVERAVRAQVLEASARALSAAVPAAPREPAAPQSLAVPQPLYPTTSTRIWAGAGLLGLAAVGLAFQAGLIPLGRKAEAPADIILPPQNLPSPEPQLQGMQQPVDDPGLSAVALVKSWRGPDGVKTVGELLEGESPQAGGLSPWLYDTLDEGSHQVMFYSFQSRQASARVYEFEARLAEQTVLPLNEPARELLAAKASTPSVPPRRPLAAAKAFRTAVASPHQEKAPEAPASVEQVIEELMKVEGVATAVQEAAPPAQGGKSGEPSKSAELKLFDEILSR